MLAWKFEREGRNLKVAGVIWGLALLIGAAILLLRFGDSPEELEETDANRLGDIELSEFASPTTEQKDEAALFSRQVTTREALTPKEVIDNRDCRMTMGKGAASDLALVVILGSGSARFSVVDYTGTLHSGVLTMPISFLQRKPISSMAAFRVPRVSKL